MNNILFKTLLLKGEDGNSIASIEKTATAGNTDTYTITLTDSSTYTFTVTNGEDGKGIVSIAKTSTVGLVDTYTITYTDNTTSTFTVTNGADGATGADGRGIVSITKTATVGVVDTYTITYTDNTTSTFTVTNGSASASNTSFDPSNTSLPSTANTVQKAIEALAPPAVTVTLIINGAKEDSITIKDGKNQTVGTCIFSSGQTSGTCQISVPTGGGLYKFISQVAKDTTSGTNDYEKTVTLTDNATQTVNLFPDGTIYWYGNEIVPIFGGVRDGYGSVTKNTNNITITGNFVGGQHFGRAWIYNTLDFTNVNAVNVMVDSINSTMPSRESGIKLGKGSGFSATVEGTFTDSVQYQNTSGRVKMFFNASSVSGSGQFVYYINPSGNAGETNTLTVKITQIIRE